MRRHTALGSCAAAAILLTSCTQDRPTGPSPADLGSGPSLEAAPSSEKIPGRYIVRFRDDVQDVAGLARALAVTHGGSLRHVYEHAIKGFSLSIPDATAPALARHPLVRYVEQDQVVRIIAEQAGATWGIDRIDQRNLPLSTTYLYNATGQGVKSYIIDTGIRTTHSDFGGRAIHGTDKVDNDNDASDCNGHGTHVAGTVGGTTWGVAKNVTLVAVRVLNCSGSGSWEGVIAGVDWVTADHQAGQPASANMSLGGGFSQSVNDAVARAVADGVVMAVAAGNGYSNACDGSPASTPEAMTIGATNSIDKEADFSDRGNCLDMWAPGVGITSAWSTSDNATNTISGTSMATPHVAGAAALYLEANPTATPAQVDNGLTAEATTGKISWTDFFGVKPPPPPAGQDYLLYTGFINAAPPTPPAAPTNLDATATSSSQIDLTWTDNADNEDGFKIERCTGAGCTDFAQLATVGANVTSFDDTGLEGSTTYGYRVRAHKGSTNSGYSNVDEATTQAPPAPPAAPSNLDANTVSSSQINVAWTDNADNEDSFDIERCLGAGCTDFDYIATVGANVTSYDDSGLAANTTYAYRVRAHNGGGSSDYSNVDEATTQPPPAPAAPSNLNATAVSSSQINLTWTDNANNEDGFKIERCTGAGCTDFAEIATVGANVTSFNNTGLAASTTYRYQVRAHNAGGNSGYSNIAEATTQSPAPAPVAKFSWKCGGTNGTSGRTCDFDGTPSLNEVSYLWNFGDPNSGSANTSTAAKPRHRFTSSGTYQVKLEVKNSAGVAHSVTCAVATGVGKTGQCNMP